jgi:hypothetical protein
MWLVFRVVRAEVYQDQSRSFAVSQNWEAVSQGRETLTDISLEVLTDIEDFMCYSYSNLESVRTNCSYD